jgi:uncharacterized membrane protein
MKSGMTAADIAIAPAPRRLDFIDAARGMALIGMFVFHLGWDVTFLGLVDYDIPGDPRWIWLARIVAGSFLTLTGISLVLATRNGIDWRAFGRRLAMVGGAAVLVTLGTSLMVPDAYVTFGILHHIAVASLLALAFLRWPTALIGLASAAMFIVPAFVRSGAIRAPLFESPYLQWLGLAREPAAAVDFVPVLPWFGCVLAGLVLGRVLVATGWLRHWRATNPLSRLLTFGGRHSLIVYLVHQPVFIGLLMALSLVIGRAEAPDQSVFIRDCERACLATGTSIEVCRGACACTIDRLKAENIWDRTADGRLTPADQTRITELAGQCLRP